MPVPACFHKGERQDLTMSKLGFSAGAALGFAVGVGLVASAVCVGIKGEAKIVARNDAGEILSVYRGTPFLPWGKPQDGQFSFLEANSRKLIELSAPHISVEHSKPFFI